MPNRYKFAVNKWFQRRRFKCESYNVRQKDGYQVMAKGPMAFGQGELKLEAQLACVAHLSFCFEKT
jgi:hypothetical protein